MPTHTLPRLPLSSHIEDLEKLMSLFVERGLRTENTRLSRYIKYFKEVDNNNEVDESKIFKNSVGEPFNSSIDWRLYILREVHELMWIFKGISNNIPKGVDEKLKKIVGGRDFATLDSDSTSRNFQFELRIASFFCQSGCKVDLSMETDIIAEDKKFCYFIECKRITNDNALQKRINDGYKQLYERMPKKYNKKPVYGVIAVDVTKLCYRHNGLIFAQTPEHAKDINYHKIAEVADNVDIFYKFDNLNIIDIMLNIHIASLIVHPPTPSSRFMHYSIFNPLVDFRSKKAINRLIKIYSVCQVNDERAIQPKEIKYREYFNFPAGTEFWIEEELLSEFIKIGDFSKENHQRVIAGLRLDGQEYEFTLSDFWLVSANLSQDDINKYVSDRVYARADIICKMYAYYFRYEDMS